MASGKVYTKRKYTPKGPMTYLSVGELKKLYFESHFQHLRHFIAEMGEQWPPGIPPNTILNWNKEKKEWLKKQQQDIDVANTGQGFGSAVNNRMDLMSYLQEKLLAHAVKNKLDLKDIAAIVETMNTLSKVQDRTATQFGGRALTVSEYEAQKGVIDGLLDEAIGEAPDELDKDNPNE